MLEKLADELYDWVLHYAPQNSWYFIFTSFIDWLDLMQESRADAAYNKRVFFFRWLGGDDENDICEYYIEYWDSDFTV